MAPTKRKNNSGGGRGRRNNVCSFCGKGQTDAGPIVEGPDNVRICAACIDLCRNIIRQEQRKQGPGRTSFAGKIQSPREIKEFLDQYVVGQERAKRVLAVGVHNHYKRLSIADDGSVD